mgnify:FL=1
MGHNEVTVLANLMTGYAWQWFRAPKKLPNWLSPVGMVLMLVGVYAWVTPDFGKTFAADWRGALAGLVGFGLASRGTARVASTTGAAPKTDSL